MPMYKIRKSHSDPQLICTNMKSLFQSCVATPYILFIYLFLVYWGIEKSEVAQLCPTLCDPMDTRLLRPGDFLGKSTGVGCCCLLQGTSRPRDRTQVSHIVDRRFPSEPPLDLSQKAKKLACCNLWHCKEMDTTEGPNWTVQIENKD